jgi:vitamin B12 transporter
MSHAILILLALLLVLPAGPSIAKNATTSLQEVVVSASRVPEMKREITTNIQVIGQEDIELSTADTLGELLAEKSIGHIHKYPGTLTSIGIRGFRTDSHGNDLKGKVLVLLNGRRAGTGNVAKIMTKNVERIEIIRGPSSVQYGSAAIGGLVNVITKQGQGEPSGFIQGGLGSFDRQSAGSGASGEVKDFDFSGSYSRSIRDDYTTADGKKYANTGYQEKEHASVNLGYTFLPGNRIGFIYTGFNTDKVGSPSYLSQNDLDDYADKSNESIDFIYDGSTPDNLFSWKTRYFTGQDKSITHTISTASESVYQSKTDNQGAQAQATYNPGQYRLTAGWDWANYKVDSGTEGGTITEYEYDNPSYFLLGKAGFLNRSIILSAGLRYDEYEIKHQNEGVETDDQHTTPSLGIAWLPMSGLKLRANYSEGFRMPSGDRLYGSYSYEGNTDLEPEESSTYEAGIDYAYRTLQTSLTYFYNDYQEMIVTIPISEFRARSENVGEATTSGIEGSLSWDAGPLLDLNWSLVPYGSFVYMTEYEDERTNQDLQNVSDLSASWGLRARDYHGFSADLNFSYTGEQTVEDWENYNWMTMDNPAIIEKGGFTVANLSLSQRIADIGKFGDLTLRGEIRNLLNKDYSYVEGYPMPGRSFFLEAKYRF